MAQVASIVLFTDHLEAAIAFYRAVGIDLGDENHGDGAIHSAADVGGVHVAVYSATESASSPGWRAAGSTFAGFYVPSLDQVVTSLTALGAEVLLDHQVRDWGCRCVFSDPDGRAVEVNQRGHCLGTLDN